MECHKVSRLPPWQPAWKPSKRRGFAASPIDTARPQENQRLETRHVGASKRAFHARLPPFLYFVASKSTFSYEFSYEPPNLLPQNRYFVRGFHQFSAHKYHAYHRICTLSPLDAALTMRFVKITPQDRSKVLRLPRKMKMDTSKVLRLPRKLELIFWSHTKRFSTRYKHVWMSPSATPATRNEATRLLKPPKVTSSAELTIGTAIATSRGRLRRAANGCAPSSEHTLNPQTPRVKREPLLRIRENHPPRPPGPPGSPGGMCKIWSPWGNCGSTGLRWLFFGWKTLPGSGCASCWE